MTIVETCFAHDLISNGSEYLGCQYFG